MPHNFSNVNVILKEQFCCVVGPRIIVSYMHDDKNVSSAIEYLPRHKRALKCLCRRVIPTIGCNVLTFLLMLIDNSFLSLGSGFPSLRVRDSEKGRGTTRARGVYVQQLEKRVNGPAWSWPTAP
jgi:hypothetical protein